MGCSQVMCICVWLLEVLWLGEERGHWEDTLVKWLCLVVGEAVWEPTLKLLVELQITSAVVKVVLVFLPRVQTLHFLLDNDICFTLAWAPENCKTVGCGWFVQIQPGALCR